MSATARRCYSGKSSLYGKCFITLLLKSLNRIPNASSGRYLYVLNASRQFSFRNLFVVSPAMRTERDISAMLKEIISTGMSVRTAEGHQHRYVCPYCRGSSAQVCLSVLQRIISTGMSVRTAEGHPHRYVCPYCRGSSGMSVRTAEGHHSGTDNSCLAG